MAEWSNSEKEVFKYLMDIGNKTLAKRILNIFRPRAIILYRGKRFSNISEPLAIRQWQRGFQIHFIFQPLAIKEWQMPLAICRGKEGFNYLLALGNKTVADCPNSGKQVFKYLLQ